MFICEYLQVHILRYALEETATHLVEQRDLVFVVPADFSKFTLNAQFQSHDVVLDACIDPQISQALLLNDLQLLLCGVLRVEQTSGICHVLHV